MNQSLASLYQRRLITLDDALGRSSDTEELRNMLGIGPAEAGKKAAPAA
jgi:twitching motility protein PilT